MKMDSAAIVRAAYDAFLEGNMHAFVSALTTDVEWIHPILGRFSGREGVRDFFARLDRGFQIDRFDPQEFIAQGDAVVVVGAERLHLRATGRYYDSDWAHVLRLRGDKVASLRMYLDTNAIMAALGETPAERAAALAPMGVKTPFSEPAKRTGSR